MKIINKLILLWILCLIPFHLLAGEQNWDNAFTFIIAADMRNFANEDNYSTKHFPGALHAIKRIGKGAFLISPGDIDADPPEAVREIITRVLGADYPWYPVIGNHEPESPSMMEYLRNYNKDGKSLPNLVNKGPKGCEETTYSFDWDSCHFVVINQYYDGERDWSADGDVVPELLNWLENDLQSTNKKFIFVFGHEPIISMPDLDNGRIRHQGDSLDKYPKNLFRFHQVMQKYGVLAYACGHTHNTSIGKINGIWQLDSGHARGIENKMYYIDLYNEINTAIQEGRKAGLSEQKSIDLMYERDESGFNKLLKYVGLDDFPPPQALSQFYLDYKAGGETREKLIQAFWENIGYSKSSFMKVYVSEKSVKVEVYRDDGRGGDYSLRYTEILN